MAIGKTAVITIVNERRSDLEIVGTPKIEQIGSSFAPGDLALARLPAWTRLTFGKLAAPSSTRGLSTAALWPCCAIR
jgi:hypothetical protein